MSSNKNEVDKELKEFSIEHNLFQKIISTVTEAKDLAPDEVKIPPETQIKIFAAANQLYSLIQISKVYTEAHGLSHEEIYNFFDTADQFYREAIDYSASGHNCHYMFDAYKKFQKAAKEVQKLFSNLEAETGAPGLNLKLNDNSESN